MGKPDFAIFCSSLAVVLPRLGQADYAAANAYLDALAVKLKGEGIFAVSINWDGWQEVGMAARATAAAGLEPDEETKQVIRPEEGVEILRRILANEVPNVAVCTRPLMALLTRFEASFHIAEDVAIPTATHARPASAGDYVAAENSTQQALVEIWTECLGISDIGVHDDFFDLGGDSLLAT